MLMISAIVSVIFAIAKFITYLLKKILQVIFVSYKFLLALFPVTSVLIAVSIVLEVYSFVSSQNIEIPDFNNTAVISNAAEYTSDYTYDSNSIKEIIGSSKISLIDSSNNQTDDILKDDTNSAAKEFIQDSLSENADEIVKESINDAAKSATDYAKESLFSIITSYWQNLLKKSSDNASYYLYIFLTIILAIPASVILLVLSAITSYKYFLCSGLVIDMTIYIARSLASMTTPFSQFKKRYNFLFHKKASAPENKDLLYEAQYRDWLRRHHDEFANDTFNAYNGYYDDFYDNEEARDDFYDDDDSYDEYDDNTENDDDFYEEYDEDDEYDDGDDFYDDDYSEDRDTYDDDKIEDENYDDDMNYQNNNSSRFHSNRKKYDNYKSHNKNSDDFNKEYKENSSNKNNNNATSNSYSSFNFFAGCKSKDSVKKKYYALVKIYHPDNMDGDTKAIQEINRQYKEIIKKFAS